MQEKLKTFVNAYIEALKLKKYEDKIFKKSDGDYFLDYYTIVDIASSINKLDKFFEFCHSVLDNYYLNYYHPSPITYVLNKKSMFSIEEKCNNEINRVLKILNLNYEFPKISSNKIIKKISFCKDNSRDVDFERLFFQLQKLLNKVEYYIKSNRFYEADFHIFYFEKNTTEGIKKNNLLEKTLKKIEKINNKEFEYDILFFDNDDGQLAVNSMLECFWESFYISQFLFSHKEVIDFYDLSSTEQINYDDFVSDRIKALYFDFDIFLSEINYCNYDDLDCDNIISLIESMYPKLLDENIQFKGSGEILLDSLIGLKDIKDNIKKIKSYCVANKERKLNLHMCFYGNPGTGKTEVARIIGKIFKENKILKRGHIVEVSRKDLVGLYIGHTAVITNMMIQQAMGGILFIDEAYSLYQGENDIFGREAIDTLIKAMEDYRGEFCVILAGYQNNMKKLIDSNEGFQSRIQFDLNFPNYSRDELGQIANIFLKNQKYSIDPNAFVTLIDIIEYKKANPNFANAREVRNAIDRCILNQCVRLSEGENDYKIILEDVKKYSDELKIYLPKSDKSRLKTAEEELDGLVGLSSVKKIIRKIRAVINKNEDSKSMNLHMCFYGNPGTGKTVVANIMSRLLYELGALSEAKIVAVSAKDLIAEYVGQTGPKTQSVIDKAMGGVLFIDEAYSITMSQYGEEAIAILLQEMENKRGQFVVIFAGYEKETDEMLAKNSGLKSRIRFNLNFEDYNNEEIGKIVKMMIGEKYSITDDAFERIIDIIDWKRSLPDFANARTARNLVEDVIMNQNFRTEEIGNDNLITIEDVEEYISDNKIEVSKINEKDNNSDFINQSLIELEMIQYFNVDKNIINNSYLEQCVVSIFSSDTQGTGFIISPNGFVLTCSHCLSKNLNNQKVRIKVATADNDMIDIFDDFVVIKEDKENDIAILKLKGKLNKYKYIPLSKINEANIAPLKSFYMVGYPFGGETFKNLSYIEGKIASINTVDKRKVIFADMFGKPGNSGGPIIDTEKQNVIGIYWGGIKKGDEMINCFTPVEIIWNLIRNKE